jgi:hypothetical protein
MGQKGIKMNKIWIY